MTENLAEQLALLPEYFRGHLALTLISLIIGITISIPLGVWAAQAPRVKRPLLTLVSIIQTFPSVAILALVVAMLGGRIGSLPAIIALVLYSMLPIVRNTVTGLENVAEEVVTAARGIGMSPRQILTKVRIPLALPVIIAGIRTAAVWTVGLATLSTLVGASSFGNYIFTGLQTRNLLAVTVGSLAAASMAVILDSLIGGFSGWRPTEARPSVGSTQSSENSGDHRTHFGARVSGYSLLPEKEVDIVIGGKGFTEQYIVAGAVEEVLQEAGFTTEQRLGLGTEVVFQATANNTIDVYLEYSGTVWSNLMNRDDNPGREAVMLEVEAYIAAEHGMTNLARLGFQNLYALAMRREQAEQLGIRSISDLKPFADGLVAGGDLEFFGRPEWISLRDTYRIDFAEKLTFDTTLMYTAIAEEQVDVIAAYTTDGRVAEFDLVILEDPLNAIPPYDGFLAVSGDAMDNRLFVETLSSLAGKISDEVMRNANRLVDVENRPVTDGVRYIREVLTNRGGLP